MGNNKQAKQKKKSQQKRIPDANHWTYTNLLKRNWISEATLWTYTNLLNKEIKVDTGCQSLGLYQSPTAKTTFGCHMPIYLGLYQPPTYDHRKTNAKLHGLTIVSSHTNKQSNI